jgi:hypothetical protein
MRTFLGEREHAGGKGCREVAGYREISAQRLNNRFWILAILMEDRCMRISQINKTKFTQSDVSLDPIR